MGSKRIHHRRALISIVLLVGGCGLGLEPSDATVTIVEIVQDPLAFDDTAVIVAGTYLVMHEPIPDCVPIGGDNPQVVDSSYLAYRSTWYLAGDNGARLGTEVVIAGGIGKNSTRPDFSEGEQLVLSGTIRHVVLAEYCNHDNLHHGAYLELTEAEVGLFSRIPSTLPNDK